MKATHIYRFLFGASLIFLMLLIAQQLHRIGSTDTRESVLLCILALVAVFMLFSTVYFYRVSLAAIWIGTLALCTLFSRYGWHSRSAPFVLHESHTFDPTRAAAEAHRFTIQSEITQVMLLGWLLTLPILRTILAGGPGTDPNTAVPSR